MSNFAKKHTNRTKVGKYTYCSKKLKPKTCQNSTYYIL